jgi:hypothetical protein
MHTHIHRYRYTYIHRYTRTYTHTYRWPCTTKWRLRSLQLSLLQRLKAEEVDGEKVPPPLLQLTEREAAAGRGRTRHRTHPQDCPFQSKVRHSTAQCIVRTPQTRNRRCVGQLDPFLPLGVCVCVCGCEIPLFMQTRLYVVAVTRAHLICNIKHP